MHGLDSLLKADAGLLHFAGERGDSRQDENRAAGLISAMIVLQYLVRNLCRALTIAGGQLLFRDVQQALFIRRGLQRTYNL